MPPTTPPRCSLCRRPMIWDAANQGWRCDCQDRQTQPMPAQLVIERGDGEWHWRNRHTTPHIREDA